MNGEYIGQIAVVPLGPDVPTGGCVDQLGSDPDTIAGLTDRTLKNVTDTEYPDVTGALAPGRALYLGFVFGPPTPAS